MSDENKTTEQINEAAQVAQSDLQQADIERADREAAAASARATRRRVMAILPALVLVAVVGFQFNTLRLWTIGPSPAAVQADLETALSQATIDVKAYQLRTGAMPEKLPNAALASVVSYKKTGPRSAVLTGKIGGETKEKSI